MWAASGTSGGIFDFDACARELQELETQAAAPDFWNDQNRAQDVFRRTRHLKNNIKLVEGLEAMAADAGALVELAEEGEDVAADLQELMAKLGLQTQEAELRTILSGDFDDKNAFLTIHSGAGGTESQDWAEMLLRMYLRYAEKKGFSTRMIDTQPGEEAGIKSATFLAEGEYAFGFLKAESGVHRLVRISPFDSAARRHTSFASVFVYPEISDDIDVAIEEKDIRVDTFCASGPGGQGVNTTYSAVRITHFPTGIVVQCQNERSQIRNKEVAMKVLRARLFELELEKKRAEIAERENAKKDIAWGSQIRSYVFQPYQMVKDHRTGYEVGQVSAVMDGELDGFIEAYLQRKLTGGKAPEPVGMKDDDL